MKKQLISSIASIAIICNSIGFNLTANAKVIEPEIVKTETWTTSYYIDDDIETLYPYIDCQADIYSDGTIKVYFWNTHEWDGFATVSHRVTIINSDMYVKTDRSFDIVEGSSRKPLYYPIDISYYPSTYYCSNYDFNASYASQFCHYDLGQIIYADDNSRTTFWVYSYNGPLPELPLNGRSYLTFTPKIDPTETFEFRILGHDITITPELLSSNIIAEPQLSETEQKIKALEEENAKLKEENNNLQRVLASYGNRAYGDMNNDGFVDAGDASILLTYYAKTSVGYTGTLDDFIQEQDKVEN